MNCGVENYFSMSYKAKNVYMCIGDNGDLWFYQKEVVENDTDEVFVCPFLHKKQSVERTRVNERAENWREIAEEKLRKRRNRDTWFDSEYRIRPSTRNLAREAALAQIRKVQTNDEATKKPNLESVNTPSEDSRKQPEKKSSTQKSKHQGKAKTFKRKTKRRGRV